MNAVGAVRYNFLFVKKSSSLSDAIHFLFDLKSKFLKQSLAISKKGLPSGQEKTNSDIPSVQEQETKKRVLPRKLKIQGKQALAPSSGSFGELAKKATAMRHARKTRKKWSTV